MRNEELSYFEDEEFKQLLQKYEQALEDGQTIYLDADEYTDIAEYYMVNQREQDANQCILLATSLHPDSIDPFVFLARQQLFHGNLDEAQRIASSINEQQDREVQFLWAEIYIKAEQPEKAEKLLQDYYNQLDEERDYFLYDTAGVYIDYALWDQAMQWAMRLEQEFPQFPKSDLLICEIQIGCGNIEPAIESLDAILTADPFNCLAWELLAEAYTSKGEYGRAIDAAEYLLAIDENHLQATILRANSLFHLERFEEAHHEYNRYLQRAPYDAPTMVQDAMVLVNLQRWDEAYKLLQAALPKLDKQSGEYEHALFQYGYVASKVQGVDEAMKIIEDIYQTEGRQRDSQYYFIKGHILLENKRYDEANALFEESSSLAENFYHVRHMIAIDYIESELYDLAIDELKGILRSPYADNKEECYPYIAYAMFHKGGDPEYNYYLQLAAQTNPQLTQYLFQPIYPNLPLSEYGKPGCDIEDTL